MTARIRAVAWAVVGALTVAVSVAACPWWRLRCWVRHATVMAGYWVRPYDMHLDARRWRWERSGRRRSYDALAALTPEQREALIAAARAAIARRASGRRG